MVLEVFCILILQSSLIWESWDDRNGDNHNAKNDDWILRGLLMALSSMIVAFIHPDRNFIQAFVLAFISFAALFPWLINYIHYKRGVAEDPKWWARLSPTAIPDKWVWYYGLRWWQRAIMYAILLAFAIKLYFCWETFSAWDACL